MPTPSETSIDPSWVRDGGGDETLRKSNLKMLPFFIEAYQIQTWFPSDEEATEANKAITGRSEELGSKTCQTCGETFEELADQRQHFKLDWHRFVIVLFRVSYLLFFWKKRTWGFFVICNLLPLSSIGNDIWPVLFSRSIECGLVSVWRWALKWSNFSLL